MPPLIPLLLTLCVIAILVYVAYSLIVSFPTYGVPTMKMLLVAVLCIIVIFILSAVLNAPILGGLRLT